MLQKQATKNIKVTFSSKAELKNKDQESNFIKVFVAITKKATKSISKAHKYEINIKLILYNCSCYMQKNKHG